MTNAIAATYSDFKLLKTRKVCQICFEIPMEKAKEALDLLGMPNPHAEQWVGIALLAGEPKKAEPEKPKKRWHEMSRAQRAGILCSDERFREFLNDECNACDSQTHNLLRTDEEVAKFVRGYCGVESRADLDSNMRAASTFDEMVSGYRAWAGLDPEQRT